MNQNNNLNNSNNSSNNNDNDNVILIKEEIKQYLIKKGYDPNSQVKNLPKNQSIYANDYEKANYFPPDLITDGGIFPWKHKFMPSIIAKRGFFPKWDNKAKAKWPGFVNSLLMWPGKYYMTTVVCISFCFLAGLIIMIAVFSSI